jgi:hypothetical protein
MIFLCAVPVFRFRHACCAKFDCSLVAWFVVWVWSFAGVGVTDYLLFIVSGFIFIAVSLRLILSRVGRAHNATNGDAPKGDDKPASFRHWARWDFDTWGG